MASATPRLHGLQDRVDARLKAMRDQDVVRRIWRYDHTVWKPDPTEITSPGRLGWLTVIEPMLEEADAFARFADEVAADGFQMAVLLGMGGSSLAPEVFQRTYGTRAGRLDLRVLDTTDPKEVLALARAIDLKRALFIVASKSGSTIETLSHLAFFWARVPDGRSFIAITDAGTPLEALARERGFRRVFLNPPQVGGRYSALTYFGLVPAALIGVDLGQLLGRAREMLRACRDGGAGDENPGAWLGAVIGEASLAGRDQLTLLLPDAISALGDWIEQLVAESTGKEGRGILPVIGEALGDPGVYGEDRLFVSMGDHPGLDALAAAGQPVVRLPYSGPYQLGAELFRWEFATAVAGHVLNVNPFEQPDVQAAKDATARVLAADAGPRPEVPPELRPEPVEGALEGPAEGPEPGSAPIASLAALVRPGDYIAIQAYVPREPAVDQELQDLRRRLRDRFRVATTLGYGPRYLHSTGQLHKGGPPTGVFLQIVSDDPEDAPVPGKPYTFGGLKQAQALGDRQALASLGRRLITVKAGADPAAVVRRLASEI